MTIINGRPTCFYHPIKVIILAENSVFIDAIDIEISAQSNMFTLTNADAILDEIDRHSKDNTQSIFRFANDVNLDTNNTRVVEFVTNKTLDLLYDKTRFDRVAVLVVNNELPTVNGFEFCEQLKNREIYKIMIIAEGDKDNAINAFNNGLIDRCLIKTSQDLYPSLTFAVQELTHRYFRELSLNLINEYLCSTNFLFDNDLYRQLLSKIASQAQAVEYYLVDSSGSVLFLDKDANPTWLIIRNLEELSEQTDLLQGYDMPGELMDSISKNEKILFLFSEADYKKPLNKWIDYLFDSNKLDDNFYYSIIQDQITDSIDWGRIVSYSAYQAQNITTFAARDRIMNSTDSGYNPRG